MGTATIAPIQPDEDITRQLRAPEPSNIVSWDSDSDQLNPMNWSTAKRWANTAVISVMTFSTPLASTMFAPGVPLVIEEFHSTKTILQTLVVSIFVLGFAMGALIAAPISELYGRKPIYLTTNFLFLMFTLGCGLSTDLTMLIVFRFFAGCAGGPPTALGGASIGDMFLRDQRGIAMAIWGMGPLMGPIVGPIIGGVLAATCGWRWAFWLEAIIAGVSFIGLGCGIAIGLFISGKVSDPIFKRLTEKNGGIAEPEYRLPALMLTSPLIALAFFVYGWTAQLKVHWIVPIIGTSFFGVGMIPAFLSINMYLVDSFPTYAASAIAATKVFQSIGGAFLPLAGQPLYSHLGLGWGNSVLGFVALMFFLVPILFF